MNKWKILHSSSGSSIFFKDDAEFINWYDGSHLAQYETSSSVMEMAQNEDYYVGLGYKLIYLGESPKVTEELALKSNTPKCLHPRKYLNKISNSLEFTVCPDCKEEVKDTIAEKYLWGYNI
jgi:hypothetical protein